VKNSVPTFPTFPIAGRHLESNDASLDGNNGRHGWNDGKHD